MPWFLYHLDNQNIDKNLHGLIVDKVDLELYRTDWINGKDKAIFPKMKKGDTVVATQNDMPIGAYNWELTLYCPKCSQYHYKWEECKMVLPDVTAGVPIICGGIESLIKIIAILIVVLAVIAVGSIALFVILTIAAVSIVFGGVVLLLMP